MERYIQIKLFKATIIFLAVISFLSVVFVAIPLFTQEQPSNSRTRETSTDDISQKDNTRHNTLDGQSIQSDLSYNRSLQIKEQEVVDGWVIVVVEPEDKSTDPALLIYKHDNDTYTLTLGPGTSFTENNFTDRNIPKGVLSNHIVRRFLASRKAL